MTLDLKFVLIAVLFGHPCLLRLSLLGEAAEHCGDQTAVGLNRKV